MVTKSNQLILNLCDNRVVLMIILTSELLAIVLTLAHGGGELGLLTHLAYISVFIQSVALTDAAIICYLKKYLLKLTPFKMGLAIYIILQLVTYCFTELSYKIVEIVSQGQMMADTSHSEILIHNLSISAIITAVLMRYLYIQQQWRQRLKAENRARIDALQARIRPHFLFNSMNTIANLIHGKPDKAENAILDLADLFRSTLADHNMIPLTEELEITQRYVRIEELRLGSRLSVKWNAPSATEGFKVPALILQPLVENAIYHGIEPLPEGGTITVNIEQQTSHMFITITNPVCKNPNNVHRKNKGNQIALNNIKQRLMLTYGNTSNLKIEDDGVQHIVTLKIPTTEVV